MADRRVRADDLERFTRQVFEGLGMPPADAAVQAEVLVWANLRGVDSHGVTRLESYSRAIDSGAMNVRPEIRVLSERAGAIFIEADHAMGPVVTCFAVERVAEKARAAGVGWALIRNTTHQGAMGYYVEKLALQGLAGIAVVCNPPNMAPPGAKPADGSAQARTEVAIAVGCLVKASEVTAREVGSTVGRTLANAVTGAVNTANKSQYITSKEKRG